MPRIAIAVKDQVRYREAKRRAGKVPCEACGAPGRRFVRFCGTGTQTSTSWADLCDRCAQLVPMLRAILTRPSGVPTHVFANHLLGSGSAFRLQIGAAPESCHHCGDPEATYAITALPPEPPPGSLIRGQETFRGPSVVVVLCKDDLRALCRRLAQAFRTDRSKEGA